MKRKQLGTSLKKKKSIKKIIKSKIRTDGTVIVLDYGEEVIVKTSEYESEVKIRNSEYYQFKKVKKVKIEEIKTKSDFIKVLNKYVDNCEQTFKTWVPLPSSTWIKDIYSSFRKERRTLVKNQFVNHFKKNNFDWSSKNKLLKSQWNWERGVELSNLILIEYFKKANLDDIINKSKELGQFNLNCGIKLKGKYINENLSYFENLNISKLKEKLKILTKNNIISPFRIKHNSPFLTTRSDLTSIDDLDTGSKDEKKCKKDLRFIGSLNTVHSYDKRKNKEKSIPELNDYFNTLSRILKPEKNFELNKDLYFIWKFPCYATAYHQDVHTFPHCVLYNQTSGVSTFHFLPVLIGRYLTWKGIQDPSSIIKILDFLDFKKIGQVVDLKAGEVILILPSGTHGVWVPSTAGELNKGKFNFQVSSIRAAEVFLKSVKDEIIEKYHKNEYDYFQKKLDNLQRNRVSSKSSKK